jgi:hypothetical protein
VILLNTAGGVDVQSRYSSDNFRYFALCRFAGMSAARIFECLELDGSDCSVVTKGVKAAAKMLQMPIKTDIK